jgi:penicillin-binding protein 1A
MNDADNGGVGYMAVIQYARKFGLTTLKDSDAVISLAVGTAPVKLIELTSAYSIFPNLGVKTDYFSVQRVMDKSRVVLFDQPNGTGKKQEVLNPAVASLMETMLRSVCTGGTASATLRSRGMADRPCGGKTGTGNDFKDAWFVGFTPHIVCGVWVGFDSEETTLGGNAYGTGATAALPIWIGFMKAASEVLGLPKDDFTYTGITTQRVCRDSHERATPNCPQSAIYTEYFVAGTELTRDCHIHGSSSGTGTPFSTPRRDRRGF